MFKFSKRNSEHDDIYGRIGGKKNQFTVKEDEEEGEIDIKKKDEDFREIKEACNIDRNYEVYLETEKKYHLWSKKWFSSEPMDIVADKIRKAEPLDHDDLRAWAAYNFLAFPEEE